MANFSIELYEAMSLDSESVPIDAMLNLIIKEMTQFWNILLQSDLENPCFL